MKKLKGTVILAVVLSIALLMVSCAVAAPLNFGTTKEEVPDGYGELSLSVAGNTRSMTISSYEVTATKSGESDVTQSTSNSTISLILKLGVWHIEVIAKNSDGSDVYYGYNDVNVIEGGTSATIGLAAKTGAAKYTCSYAFDGYVSKVKVTASRTNFSDRVKQVDVPTTATGTVVYLFDLLEGDWSVVIEAMDSSNEVYFSKSLTQTIATNVLSKETETLDQAKVTNVDYSPVAGEYSTDQSITLSCTTASSNIHYTTDGSTPTGSSATYSAPISVAGNGTVTTIKAIAIKTGLTNSYVASGTYTISYNSVAAVSFSPVGGSYNSDQSVTLSCGTAGATIYYSTDGSAPSLVYSAPLSVASGTTQIRAKATKSGMADSSETSATYVIDYPNCDVPTFTPVAGTYTTAQSVNIFCSTPSSTIYYTTDGSTPTTSSSVFGSAISLSSDGTYTIKAIGTASGYDQSTVSSATYVINLQDGANLTFQDASNVIVCDQFQSFSFSNQSVQYLSFDAQSAGSYTIEWSDSGDGDGTDTADIKMTLIENDMVTVETINGVDDGYNTNKQTVSLSASRYFVKVESLLGGNISGTYKIKVSTSGGTGNFTLKMTKDVGVGNSIYFTGSIASLTTWGTGVEGSWTSGNVWELVITNPGSDFSWKSRKGVSGDVGNEWESDPDHSVTNPQDGGEDHPTFNGGF